MHYHFIKNLIMRNQICSEFNQIKYVAKDMKVFEKTVLKKKKSKLNKRKKEAHVGFSDWMTFQN